MEVAKRSLGKRSYFMREQSLPDYVKRVSLLGDRLHFGRHLTCVRRGALGTSH